SGSSPGRAAPAGLRWCPTSRLTGLALRTCVAGCRIRARSSAWWAGSQRPTWTRPSTRSWITSAAARADNSPTAQVDTGGDMQRNDLLTRLAAVIGMLLAWFPIAATLIFSALGTLRSGMFRLDYLMPAEFFP